MLNKCGRLIGLKENKMSYKSDRRVLNVSFQVAGRANVP